MYSQATNLAGFFYPEGAPIENKLEVLVSRLDGVLQSKDYKTAIRDLREIVGVLQSYLNETWPKFGP